MEILQRLKRAYKAFKSEEVVNTVLPLQPIPMVTEKAYKGHIFQSHRVISDYELSTTSEKISLESLTNQMKRKILDSIPDDFFETEVYSGYGNQEIKVKLIVYKNE